MTYLINQKRGEFNKSISALFGVDIDTYHHDVKGFEKRNKFMSVYYRKNPTFTPNPKFNDRDTYESILHEEYSYLLSFWVPKQTPLEDIYLKMQGEIWSPNGEARDLIRHLGLRHTSMSIGDIIENIEYGSYFEVDTCGFKQLFNHGNEKPKEPKGTAKKEINEACEYIEYTMGRVLARLDTLLVSYNPKFIKEVMAELMRIDGRLEIIRDFTNNPNE